MTLNMIVENRDAQGYPDPKLLKDLGFAGLMLAERMDEDEFAEICRDLNDCGVAVDDLITIEWQSTPEQHAPTDANDAFRIALDNDYKDVFISFQGAAILWLPASEDWYFIFARPRAACILQKRKAPADMRFNEWLSESHHSPQGRSFLSSIKQRYDG